MSFRMNDLKNFIEVAGSKTMSEAAKKLEITQPALSESIKRLEVDVKSILFYRSRSGITLTPTGQVILENAHSALTYLNEIENIHQQGTQFGSRVITLGCHPTVASYCLPLALKKLENIAPDYKINLRHDLSRNIQTEIQQGKIDVGLVINPSLSPDLIIRKIGEDQVSVWIAKNGTQNKVFCNLDLIQTQSILRKWKTQPNNKINTNSLELITRLTESGLGYGIIPERAVRLIGAHLKRVDSAPSFHDSLCILYRPEFGKSQIAREVIHALQESLS